MGVGHQQKKEYGYNTNVDVFPLHMSLGTLSLSPVCCLHHCHRHHPNRQYALYMCVCVCVQVHNNSTRATYNKSTHTSEDELLLSSLFESGHPEHLVYWYSVSRKCQETHIYLQKKRHSG